MNYDENYLAVVSEILTKGKRKGDRTGVGTKSRFGCEMRFDLSKAFPLLTTKKVNFKAVINELIWMVVKGSTDVNWLQNKGHTFWNPWVLEDGTIGRGYGQQFRRIESIRRIDSFGYTNTKNAKDLRYKGDVADPNDSVIFNLWMSLIKSCYHQGDSEYSIYGGAGVRVHDDWFDYAVFQKEVKQIYGWYSYLQNPSEYVLDHTILGGGLFSKQTCQWVKESEVELNRLFQQSVQNNILSIQYIDQIRNLIDELKHNPDSRRMVVDLWNPSDLSLMALPPCHMATQWYVWRGKLSCKMHQRSADMFLGVPFNIAFYSAMVHMLCHLTGLEPGEFIWSGGDCHIYNNHFDAFEEQFTRVPYASPTLTIAPNAPMDIDGDWKFEHFVLDNYNSHGSIKADIAV